MLAGLHRGKVVDLLSFFLVGLFVGLWRRWRGYWGGGGIFGAAGRPGGLRRAWVNPILGKAGIAVYQLVKVFGLNYSQNGKKLGDILASLGGVWRAISAVVIPGYLCLWFGLMAAGRFAAGRRSKFLIFAYAC
jgi:hypothetical protein